MDIKVNPLLMPAPTETENKVRADDGQFKFTLIKNIEDNRSNAIYSRGRKKAEKAYGYKGYETLPRAYKGIFK